MPQIDDKQQLISRYHPLDQQQVQNLKEYFKIGLTYASNALEGNALTESETKIVIEDGTAIGGKPLRDHLEAIGHARAFDFMWELAKRQEVTEADIMKLHTLCFQPSEGEVAGRYRTVNLIITGSQYNERISAHETVASDMGNFIKESKSRQAVVRKLLCKIQMPG